VRRPAPMEPREGMKVGFDVGWTSRGLRTVIRVYD
jgi:hypothetical protein